MDKPGKLYKYCDQGGLNILETNEIKVSPFFEFNDPFEMKPHFASEDIKQRAEQHLKKTFPGYSENMKYVPRSSFQVIGEIQSKKMQILTSGCEKSFEKIENQNKRVLCLSTVPNNLLMWAHYALFHKGFVIEFDGTHNFFREKIRKNKQYFRFSRPVSYTGQDNNKRPICRVSESEIKKNFEKCITNLFFIKSHDWKHEQEWRMIFPSTDKYIREEVLQDNNKRFLLKLPPDCISGVILGCRAWEKENEQESFAEKLIKTIRKKPQYASNFRIQKAVLDESEYKLNIVDYT